MDFSHNQNPAKNFTGLTVVVLLHVLLAWVLIYSGIGKGIKKIIAPPTETKIIEAPVLPPPPPEKALPPPPPLQPPPPIYIPPPEILISTPVTPTPIANVTAVAPTEKVKYETVKPAVGPTVGASLDAVTKCERPEYPNSSLRNEEEGVSTVSFLIGVDGRVTDKKVEKSSGFPALDKAALAGFGLCKFKPGLVDGQPVASWKTIAYRWSLE